MRRIIAAIAAVLALAGCSSSGSPAPKTTAAPNYTPAIGADAALIAGHIAGCSAVTSGNIGKGGPAMKSTATCTLDGHVVILDSFDSPSDAQISDELTQTEMFYASGGSWLAFVADQGATAETTTLQMQLTNDAGGLIEQASSNDAEPRIVGCAADDRHDGGEVAGWHSRARPSRAVVKLTEGGTMTAPGWYLDPMDTTREQYWNGSAWIGSGRAAFPDTPQFPDDDPVPVVQAPVSDGLVTASGVMYFLACLAVMGALFGGIALISHTQPGACDGYYCGPQTHPFAQAGWAVLIGGLVQASVIAVIGRLCQVVSELRAKAAEAAKILDR